jgi:ribosomal protein S18 acetylase RimI-like enzyme
MQSLQIRNAISSDILHLMQLDHGYRTDHVWQMNTREDLEELSVSFREVRLPRPMRVNYPRNPSRLADEWVMHSGFLVAEREGSVIGYMTFVDGPAPNAVWTTDLVVGHSDRRQGVATLLLQTGMEWCKQRDLKRLYVEMQSKNYPAISLCKKLGLRFLGYSDSYYPDLDIALFFGIDVS